ncbi:hypothetical protein DSO57_1029038 [Entomophthora muscae]|uniref:Uncharacterized protein n=1 Tax=Entomophthora muscae TaxID=34485 RepID=A0ACC2TNS8_9FUNG|nr:hypothetical protein DSO57_1029038 [Entomophthora muscae]
MRELEKLLKDLDSAIAEIKEIDRKVKAKVKSAVLKGEKIDKVSAKALMTKVPETPEKTIECLLNIQKTVVKGIQFGRTHHFKNGTSIYAISNLI